MEEGYVAVSRRIAQYEDQKLPPINPMDFWLKYFPAKQKAGQGQGRIF